MKDIDYKSLPLCDFEVGSTVQIFELTSTGLPRRRMLDLGLVPGTTIEILRKIALGDPIAYGIRGAMIALRKEESKQILVKKIN